MSTREEAPAGRLEVRGLRKSFGPKLVLDGIDLSVAEHEVVAVIGPRGCGKTPLLRCIDPRQQGDAAQEGRLPAPARPDDRHHRVLGHAQVDAVEDELGPEALAQVPHLEPPRWGLPVDAHAIVCVRRRRSRAVYQSVNRATGMLARRNSTVAATYDV